MQVNTTARELDPKSYSDISDILIEKTQVLSDFRRHRHEKHTRPWVPFTDTADILIEERNRCRLRKTFHMPTEKHLYIDRCR